MKNPDVTKKIRRYMHIYQAVTTLIMCFAIYFIAEDNMQLIIWVSGAIVVVMLISLYYNMRIKNIIKAGNDYTKVKEVISEELEYNAPVPNVVIDITGKIIWYNNIVVEMFAKRDILNKKINEIMPSLELNFLVSDQNRNVVNSFKFQERYYDIVSEQIKKQNKLTLDYDTYYTIYFIDVTEKVSLQVRYEEEKTLIAYVYIDNYEEIVNSTEETKRPMMLGVVERKLQTFAKEQGGTIKKIEKDRFLFLLSKESLDRIVEGKFKILEETRKINVGNDLPITLSIGISLIGNSIEQLMDFSKDAAELAVARGGNQAVVKKDDNEYEYYGGKAKQEVDGTNASKAKARIKAYALKEMIMGVDNVLIMGHKNADLDAIGSALGMARICKELGKNAYVILNEPNNAISILYDKVKESEDYDDDTFIKSERAMKFDSDETMLIVVDVNIPGHTECPEVIDMLDKVAVIDHHIRGNQFIEKAKVVFLDPFISSTCEAIVQMAQYMIEKIKFSEIEVDAMLAGILVDTKNFMFKTGAKTFEAAAYLKKSGADNIRVKYLFQNDLDSFKKKAEAISNAEIYHDNMVITVCPKNVTTPYTVVAQIADDLLNIIGVEASFVVYDTGDGSCNISARSNGNINVQIIMEELGGGGHFTAAGVQISDKSLEDVILEIKRCIDKYFEDENEII